MSLKGKVALVTGAAQGIGKAIAEILLKNGAKVSMLDYNQSEGEATTATFGQLYGAENILFLHSDVTSESQMQDSFIKTMEKFQKLDIVCNNAGIVNESNYEKCISVNLVGVIRGSQLALKYMGKENGGAGGVIVNIASITAFYPWEGAPVYTASKCGVVGFTKVLSLSCMKKHGVRVHALCPSFVDTPLLRIHDKDAKERLDALLQLCGPVLKPSEIAERFLELVVDQTRNGVVMKILGNGNIEYEDQPEGQHAEAQKPT
ncbi:15-hydroxyprostaglandin dehydrogenase [NAD(+)]-like isoform X2 [Pristis pectinata]|uniref:15-hydroxyprostaglandin dehydrogenase [NAD(+)]-like isoform X2 n=1 Tax=Pristis pectinata TaxID=685728 RepID=UPI00223CF4F9|nr:15-hydroxyprostaglandin dehydrogenase [NAD(+)]-like isoform X2 [Pristis pectinata]